MGDLRKNNHTSAKVTAGNDLSFLFNDDNKNSNTNKDDLNKISVSMERVHLVKFLFIFIFSVFIIRSTSLAIFPGEILSKPNKIISNSVKNPLPDIYDRNDKLLATTIETKRASIRNPVNPEETARMIKAVIPNLNKDILLNKLENKKYVEIADNINDIQYYDILNSGVAEVEFHSVWRRIYINKQLASHIIGYSGRDLIGLSGIEKTIPKSKILHEDIKLSIDIAVQFHLEDQIAKGMDLYNAESGFGIVLNSNNGQIIASASLPTFDPNVISKNYKDSAVKKSTFNQVLQGSYELGSVMKIMTLAMGLESSKIDLSDKFNDNICIKIAANRCLNNYRNQSSENLINSVDCLVRSSNRCMAQIAMRVGKENQKSFLQKVGLLDEYLLEVHETGSPILPERWTNNSMITISFGQGLSVVPLSFSSSVATMVNGGYRIQPSLNYYNNPIKEKRVISEITSKKLVYAMRQVVKYGSGKKADVEGYAVIGKTGTADIPCNGSYEGCGNRTSFVGAFPGWDPKYVILISYEKPKENHARGIMGESSYHNAGPTAGEVIRLIAPILNIEHNPGKEVKYPIQGDLNNGLIEEGSL
ncbi:MAG: penicillin-binding protein 2 [Pseudomonadota bacterium]|nr:penicillin-binding protein 2 [Pseudomonadota bacterium]